MIVHVRVLASETLDQQQINDELQHLVSEIPQGKQMLKMGPNPDMQPYIAAGLVKQSWIGAVRVISQFVPVEQRWYTVLNVGHAD